MRRCLKIYIRALKIWHFLHFESTVPEIYPGHILVSSDAETVIQDAQNLSKCINLDAQIMILDAQNQSIGVLGFRNFEYYRDKLKCCK